MTLTMRLVEHKNHKNDYIQEIGQANEIIRMNTTNRSTDRVDHEIRMTTGKKLTNRPNQVIRMITIRRLANQTRS